ncbi:MAG: hypothetical protein COB02_17300 [Candidatus Cloacimonadota bacterium]|nr:MAG: hypothetical protein COB02_17300 [Candidatus Cloacimonadota bacterium]
MKASNFKNIKLQKIDNKVKLSCSCQILDQLKEPIINSMLIATILNKEVELLTNNQGFLDISIFEDNSDFFLQKSLDEIKLIFEVSLNTSLRFRDKKVFQKFPIGVPDFETLINESLLYVDKTKDIFNLINGDDRYCFISRPRRFGKSLLVSTLESLFKGRKEFFKGLNIEKEQYSFEKFTVIRLDLSSIKVTNSGECKKLIHQLLIKNAKNYGYLGELKDYSSFLEGFYQHTNKKLVILVDEYDKPVLDNITKKEVSEIQAELTEFFGATKVVNKVIKFMFITGITKLSNANMFSDANHISDLGRHEKFSTMFGYTQHELENIFELYINILSEKEEVSYTQTLINIKDYYDGYSFSKNGEDIYNPYSILKLFSAYEFSNYWFTSGTPSFVLELIKERNFDISDKTSLEYGDELFDLSEASKLSVKNVLFQAGYLSIKKDKNGENQLVFPNKEVQDSFYKAFIKFFGTNGINYSRHLREVKVAFVNKDFKELQEVLNDYFSQFTYENTGSEKLYHSLVYSLLMLTGFKVQSEVLTKKGRIDQYLEIGDEVYIIEYKYKHSSIKAMQQIVDRQYFQKHMKTNKNIYLLAINFEKDGEIKDDILVVNPRDDKALQIYLTK